MVLKCCVPNCRGNYDAENTVHVFKFPVDEELRRKWSAAIKREHFVSTKNSVVCELHFNSRDIRRTTTFHCENGQEIEVPLKVPRLVMGAIPSKLPNCPSYLNTKTSYRESPAEKKLRRENANLQAAIEKSIAELSEHEMKISVKSLQELKDKLPQIDLENNWSVVVREKCVAFIEIVLDSPPKLKCSLVINELLELKVYFGDSGIKKVGNFTFPVTIKTVEDIKYSLQALGDGFRSEKESVHELDLLTFICDLLKNASFLNSKCESVKFITEQIMLLTQKKKTVYSSSLLIISSMLFSISPHCYKYLRHLQIITLPHPSTIRRLCSSFKLDPQAENGDQFLMYIRRKFSGKDEDKYVVLMMDEIHTKPMIDYKGGTIVGEAYNSNELATSAHCFMISSLLSNFKEIAHIVPVKSMCARNLQCILKMVIIGLETIGFRVICVVSDNNSINRKCMELFSEENVLKCIYPHPVDGSRPLFFVFDSVHLLKCIRNNWINKKDGNQNMNFPDWSDSCIKSASFACLKKLAELEQSKLVKYSYGLSLKALFPTSIERQNVKLVLQLFNDNVIEGLKVLGRKHDLLHCEETVLYIRIILDWWEIVNVKTPGKGRRLNNSFMNPISSVEDEQFQYLNNFLCWLKKWKQMALQGSLSNETMNAITITTEGFLKLINYCLSELNFNYVLLGKFQTDSLECRFGQYRQLSGAVYNVLMRQIYEVEKKIRIQSSVLSLKSNAHGSFEISEFFEPNSQPSMGTDDFIDSLYVNDDDLEACDNDVLVLVYLAGYCCHSVLNKLKCQFCREIIVIEDQLIDIDDESYCFIKNKSRGKLLYPQLPIVNIIIHNYVIISKLCSTFEEKFLRVKNQRGVALNATLQVVNEREIFWEQDVCGNGHTPEDICKKLLWVSTNIFLNNYCKKKNNLVKNVSCKRKQSTFSHN